MRKLGAALACATLGAATLGFAAAEEVFARGERAFWEGDLVGAEVAFLETLILAPDDAGAHFYLGRIYLSRKYLEKAREHLARGAGDRYPEGYFFLGMAAYDAGDYAGAADAYVKYLGYYGDDAGAWFNLGVAYSAAGQEAEAEAAYRRALAANGRYAPAVFNLAVLYHRRGDFRRAMFFWQRYLELDPTNVDAHYGLGIAAYRAGEYLDACRAFQNGSHLAPLDNRFFFQLGRCYLNLGNYELAAATFERAFELGYDEGAVAEGWGLALEGSRQYERAIPLLKRATEMRGADAGEAYAALGRIDRAQGRPGKALENFYEAAARLGNNAEVYNQIGELYLEEDMPTWAAEAFRRAVDIIPQNLTYNYNLARAYEAAGAAEALGQWRRYVALAADAPGEKKRVAEAEARIRALTREEGK